MALRGLLNEGCGMEKLQNLTQKQEQKEDNVVDFPKPKLIHSGTDSIVPPDNWLLNLPVGCDFVVKSKVDRTNFMLLNLCLMAKAPKRVVLWENMNNKLFGEVDPERFIKFFEFVEVIKDEVPSIPEEETKDE